MKVSIVLTNNEQLTCSSCNRSINKGMAKSNIAHLTIDDKTHKTTDIRCHDCETRK